MNSKTRQILEDRRWTLENSYGNGSFRDGLIRQQIERIDEMLCSRTQQLTQPTNDRATK